MNDAVGKGNIFLIQKTSIDIVCRGPGSQRVGDRQAQELPLFSEIGSSPIVYIFITVR